MIINILNNPWILFPLIAWLLIWKGWALWRAARNEAKAWFIILLIINSLGILEIFYIFGFSGWNKDRNK